MSLHELERTALVGALRAAGPDAATRCEGWASRHLAAHVRLRESAPAAGLGIVAPALAARTQRATIALGDRSAGAPAWARLLQQIAAGPPAWHPLRWGGDRANLLELFVHTEDVRRGGPDGPEVPARTRTPEHDDALWLGLSRMARLLYRRAPSGVVLVRPDGSQVRAARPPSGTGDVLVHGPVDELVLHAFGRTSVARVTLDGDPVGTAALVASR